ncbi:IclR family transcriptional regulator [Paenibacillus eucommiae]|uniref:DNA-binding IclR family transcriptional regulator n=1 Tax=Paenibacillus eucommiae TaxID=1355755 RepID=A0ABS4J1X0_9BACL|nr:IclR family transcriptional regulator [Paenibacillus eucommiae]MBP1993848.1 DNA-binding IclR family transcriptional regulator [Paenibacillus eucommiae]
MSQKTQVQSVSRACLILQLLSVNKNGLTTIEVSRYLNLNRSTTHHLMSTLQSHEFISMNLNGKYQLGPAIGEMAQGTSDATLRNIVHGMLLDLVNVTGETCYLAVFNQGVTLIDTVLGIGALRVVQVFLHQDEPAYLHARASGKLFLSTLSPEELQAYIRENPLVALTDKTISSEQALHSELELVRKNGYASDLEEFMIGIDCYGFPIIVEGKLIGCVTTSFPSALKDKHAMIMKALEQIIQRFNHLFQENSYAVLLNK